MAGMTTPIAFMHQLMYKLSHTYQDNPNKLNLALADLTDIAGLTQITDWTQLRDMIKADITTNLNNGGTAKDFLKNYCNIDLDNADCGALIGFDCSGGDILTNDNIINEEGNLQTHPAIATIRGCTVTFPTYSNSTYNYVMDGLYTWWIGLPFDLVNKSYGLGFTSESYVTSMSLDLFDDPPSGGLVTGAYVNTWYNGTIAIKLELCVNMNDAAFGTIIIGDKSGNTTSGVFAALDRILAHELTHAVMSANIRGSMVWLPHWFIEGGTAELVNGCDDSRTLALLEAAISTIVIDDGFSNNPTMAREYSVGFIAMRYLLKKYTDRQVHIYFPVKPKEPFEKVWEKTAHGIRSEHCISRDGDLNKIVNEFVDFCQRDDYNLVQPWTLCDNEDSKTLRIPLDGHENKTEDVIADAGQYINMCDCFNALDSITMSDTLLLRPGVDSWYLCTVPMYNMGNGVIYAVGIDEFDLFVYPSVRDYNIGIMNNNPLLKWSCTPFMYSGSDMSSVVSKCLEMYYTTHSGTTAPIKHDISIGFTAYTFHYITASQLAQLASAVMTRNGKLKICPLSVEYIPGEVEASPVYKIDIIEHLLKEFAEQYPSLQTCLEVNWSWFELTKNINMSQETQNGNVPYQPEIIYGSDIIDFGEICAVPNHRMTGSDPLPVHCYHVWISPSFRLNDGKFTISKKQSTDFPCFYLSTGVFKPKDWDNKGLVYPSQVINNQDDEYIPFNIHVLNDINMRFDLQGIGTCKKVTGKQNDADILNGIRQTGQNSYKADVISDPIPGIGCPLIVRSAENKFKYTDIMCYFTKSSYSGTFTLIFYNENDETINPVFQSVAFGLGVSEEESYKYPLYTAGGTSGLLPAWYSFTYSIPGNPPTSVTLDIYGNKFNCDMTKGDTLDSLLYPLTTDRCGISNFRILQSDGEWKSAINYKQYFYSDEKRTIGSYIYNNDSDDIENYLVYPTISNTNLVDRFTLVQPITVIKKHLTGENESGFMLSINGVKCKPDRLRSMMTSVDGHEYLIVPNGWFDRTLGIPLRPLQQGEYLIDVITELTEKMPKQTYVLCIDLG